MYIPYSPEHYGLTPKQDGTWVFRRKWWYPLAILFKAHGQPYRLSNEDGKKAEAILSKAINGKTYRITGVFLALLTAFFAVKRLHPEAVVSLVSWLAFLHAAMNVALYRMAQFCKKHGKLIIKEE